MLSQLKADYPDELQVTYRHFPLSGHDKALITTQVSEAAGEQGQFWEMHDWLYQRQDEWSALPVEEFETWIVSRAEELVAAGEMKLDIDLFKERMVSEQIVQKAQAAFEEGIRIGLPGTPFLLINGRIYNGPSDYFNLKVIMDLLVLAKRQYLECPPVVIDPLNQYIATLETEKGTIVIELFADKAPLAVNNFVFLAREGWFNGVTFHRVLENFMAQAGDPSGTGYGGPGYSFKNETSDLKFDQPGMVAMANAGADTNGSQFFITFAPASHLDGDYTIFGRVLEGLEVVNSITLRDPGKSQSLPAGDKILTVTIEERD